MRTAIVAFAVMFAACTPTTSVLKGSEFSTADHVWVIQRQEDRNDAIILCKANSEPQCGMVWDGKNSTTIVPGRAPVAMVPSPVPPPAPTKAEVERDNPYTGK